MTGREKKSHVASFAYLTNSFMRLLQPGYAPVVYQWIGPLLFAEVLFMLWLVIKGANPKPLFSLK